MRGDNAGAGCRLYENIKTALTCKTYKIYINGGIIYMEYIHQMIDSDRLTGIFNLPVSLRGRTVEVIILPVSPAEVKKSGNNQKSSFGALKEYANPKLIPEEAGAWERAVTEKYEND